MNENQIVLQALERLEDLTGITGDWEFVDGKFDGWLDLVIDKEKERFMAEVKTELRQPQLIRIREMAERHRPFIVIAENIFPTLKEILRNENICYLDTAGNIFVRTDKHHVWIDGHKPIIDKSRQRNRAFTKTGLKVVFYLLWNADAINWPYRRLAETTGVALGNIKNVMEGLKEAGFLLQVTKDIQKLQNKKMLLDRWVTGFREILQPTLFIGAYKFWDNKKIRDWQMLDLHQGESAWGGEAAAELMTNYLKPARLTLYTNEPRTLMKNWVLIPQDDITQGDILFYNKFWKDGLPQYNLNMAPPLLVYADLVTTDDPRCQETAGMIYEKYLRNEFE